MKKQGLLGMLFIGMVCFPHTPALAQCVPFYSLIQQQQCTTDTALLNLPGVNCSVGQCSSPINLDCEVFTSFGRTGQLIVGTGGSSHNNYIFCGGNSCRSITNIYVEVTAVEVDYLSLNFDVFLRGQQIAAIYEPSGNLDLNLPRPDAYPAGPLVNFYYDGFWDAYVSTWGFNTSNWNGIDPYGMNWFLKFNEYAGDGDIILDYKVVISYETCTGSLPATIVSTDTFSSSTGCDSIVVTETSYLPISIDTIQASICASDSFYASGSYQNISGVYLDTLISANGCDSILATDLTVIPDSVCTICNADFAYFVSNNIVSFSNISTNSTSYFWNFGDGDNSTQQNPTHTYAQNGTYQVCLTVINLNGCTDIACYGVLISGISQQYHCLFGNINSGIQSNPAFPATVYLIYNDTALGTLTAIQTTSTNQNGSYQFCNVPTGRYLVKAALDSVAAGYGSYFPTYYGNSLFWNFAQEVLLTQNAQAGITLIAGNNPGGPGFVGGLVSQGANKMQGPGDPLKDILVMLLDEFDYPVQYIYSDINGAWDFSNVAYGTYKVYAEVLGIPTYPYFVTIGPQNETVDNIALVVETTQVISSVGESLNANLYSVNIYPNPTNEILNVELEMMKDAELTVSLSDITGKLVMEDFVNAFTGNYLLRFDLALQQPGVYFVRIAGSDNFKTFKVVKY